LLKQLSKPQTIGRFICLFALFDLALVTFGLIRYPGVLEGNALTIAIPCILLIGYSMIGLTLTRLRFDEFSWLTGTIWVFGLMAAVWQMVLLYIENLTNLLSYLPHNALALFPFAILFGMFGLAGLVGAWRSRNLLAGIITATLSAMISVLLLMAYAFLQDYSAIAHLQQNLYADYLHSGLHDPQAFVIFNSLDAAAMHLTLLPIVGTLFGIGGALIGRVIRSPNVSPTG
jgi:hypothetical protein